MEEQVQQALDVLRKGGVILYPTDTVWGIGCDATDEQAVARIFALKRRDDAKSMIVLLDSAERAARWVHCIPPIALELWRAADGVDTLTLVLPEAAGLAPNLVPPERTVGVRLVRNRFCRQLICLSGHPLVSTSANISGEPTPTTYDAVTETVRSQVDWTADQSMEEPTATHKSSSIIKIDADGVFTILRP